MHSLMELSLAQAFQRAYTTLADCDGGSSASPSQAEECSRLLSHCQALAERAALFSSNEDKDDLVTAHLKYLLVPYLMAELSNLQPQQSTRPLQRLQQLQEALMMYSQFLQRCGQYGFLSGTCYDAYTAEEQGIAADPSTCRNQKVERYKRSRALKGLLQQMRGRKKAADDEVRCRVTCCMATVLHVASCYSVPSGQQQLQAYCPYEGHSRASCSGYCQIWHQTKCCVTNQGVKWAMLVTSLSSA